MFVCPIQKMKMIHTRLSILRKTKEKEEKQTNKKKSIKASLPSHYLNTLFIYHDVFIIHAKQVFVKAISV